MNTQKRKLTYAQCIEQHLTKGDLAKYYELICFDYAIPQCLFDILIEKNNNKIGNLIYHFVYCYDNKSFGELFPLTVEGEMLMNLAFPELDS